MRDCMEIENRAGFIEFGWQLVNFHIIWFVYERCLYLQEIYM